ncbi:MAG TPA: Undecaprenyl-diphosphatase [Hyphomicrobiaceae bacterium MAG_BT-2024]
MQIWQVILLGFVEGLTEFIPVSSTGHLLLAGYFLGFDSPRKSFEVLIQLGAVLAILSIYVSKIFGLLINFPHDARARQFILNVILAFLPAAVIGVLGHELIKSNFFQDLELICVSLIVGGIILMVVDSMKLNTKYHDTVEYTPWLCFKIGIFQCLAMIPGVSRSGATIVGALLMGSDKRSATEFSFFLAMPTMVGAFSFDLYKNWSILKPDIAVSISIGFIVSFVVALLVVRCLLNYVSRFGFKLFAFWRIFVGIIGFLSINTIT